METARIATETVRVPIEIVRVPIEIVRVHRDCQVPIELSGFLSV
jgi:hypothetical protein